MRLFSTLKQLPAVLVPTGLLPAQKTQGCVVLAGVALDQLSAAMQAQVTDLPVYQLNHADAQASKTAGYVQGLDLNNADAIAGFFKQLEKAGQHVELLVLQGAAPVQQAIADLQASDMQQRWQSSALTAVAVAQGAIQHMLPRRQGTLVFLGSSHVANSFSHSGSGWLADAAVQAGIRALSQSLAREFQPKGIHITYLALTEWSSYSEAAAQAIASTCWHVYRQPQSTWSQELSA